MIDLFSCPFCGHDNAMMLPPTCRPEAPYNAADRLFPIVRCGSCCAEVSGENEDYRGASAVAAWNRRVPSPDMREAVEAELAEILRVSFRRLGGIPSLARASCGADKIIDVAAREAVQYFRSLTGGNNAR